MSYPRPPPLIFALNLARRHPRFFPAWWFRRLSRSSCIFRVLFFSAPLECFLKFLYIYRFYIWPILFCLVVRWRHPELWLNFMNFAIFSWILCFSMNFSIFSWILCFFMNFVFFHVFCFFHEFCVIFTNFGVKMEFAPMENLESYLKNWLGKRN